MKHLVDWSEYGREKEAKREGAARVLKDARDGLRPLKALKLFHQHDTKALQTVVDTYEYLQVSVHYCTEESGTPDLHIDKLQELINT